MVTKDAARKRAQRAHPIARPCERCGSARRVHRHHPDHQKPEAIEFLCPSCHAKADRLLPKEVPVANPRRGAEKSLNVSLDPLERLAIERLHARLKKSDAVKYRHLSDVVRDLIRERMIREFGPQWEAHLAEAVTA